MAGNDLVEARRSQRVPRRSGGIDFILSVVAMLALGGLGWFSVGQYLMRPPTAVTVVASADSPWTDTDDTRCKAAGRAAIEAGLPADAGFVNRAAAEGFTGLVAVLHCRLTIKTERFCIPAERQALVAMVEDYLSRADIISAGLAVQGAPMRLAGAILGDEAAAGSSIYDMEREDTTALMLTQHARIVDDLQALARRGVIAERDFAGFLGMGVPERITRMLGGVEPQRNICA